ncbi:hypothetical protein [Streptomyces europaeiscabiei]|uniref:hypothetical protein n=1 Tax=Streptomyces europaeiscabiei TaxID=146819 RepID=UPI0029B5F8D9|nr:hypothetical protein [Streptomyces europaeiscabiei]MDX2766989.1 hypothetical protein [Streptomyces europaeiscabiei]
MTPPEITHRWTWTDGSDRTDLPDWLGPDQYHWHHDRPVIHTADGPRTLYDGWLVALWTDGVITVGSATVADRVYGPDGIAGRLARAEAELAQLRARPEPAGLHARIAAVIRDSPARYHDDIATAVMRVLPPYPEQPSPG